MINNKAVFKMLDEYGRLNEGTRFSFFCKCLNDMHNIFALKYNEAIIAETPCFTGHGLKHSYSILSLYDQLLRDWIKANRHILKTNYDSYDSNYYDSLFVLLAATLWHDAGMKDGRKNHAERLRDDFSITQDIKMTLAILGVAGDQYSEQILQVAELHSSKQSLDKANNSNTIGGTVDGAATIHTRAMAAILRLCDEISDDITRIDELRMDKLKPNALLYWHHSECVASSLIVPNQERVIINYEIPLDRWETEYSLSRRKKITFRQFVMHRIDKVHAEMSLCCPQFRQMVQINELEVNLIFKDKNKDGIERRTKMTPLIVGNIVPTSGIPKLGGNFTNSKVNKVCRDNNIDLDTAKIKKRIWED